MSDHRKLSRNLDRIATTLLILGLLGAACWIYEGIKVFNDGNSELASFIIAFALTAVLGLLLQVALIRASAEGLRLLSRIAEGVAPTKEKRRHARATPLHEFVQPPEDLLDDGEERVFCAECRGLIQQSDTQCPHCGSTLD